MGLVTEYNSGYSIYTADRTQPSSVPQVKCKKPPRIIKSSEVSRWRFITLDIDIDIFDDG